MNIPNIRTKAQPFGDMAPIVDKDTIPFPDRELIYKYPKNKENPIRSIIASFECGLGCRYCLSEDTVILKMDGTTMKIKNLQIGDIVVGIKQKDNREWYCIPSTIENIWQTQEQAYQIFFEDGTEVVCSADHRWLSDRGGAKEWKYTAAGGGRQYQRPYLTSKNRVRGFGQLPETPTITEDYMHGYLSGIIRGDAHLATHSYTTRKRKDNQYHFRLALKDIEGIERTEKYLQHFGIQTNSFVFSENMAGIRTHSRDNYYSILDLIRYQNNSAEFMRGFLAGIFDAEGSGGSPGRCIRIHNSSLQILQIVTNALNLFGFNFVIEKKRQKTNRQVYAIRIRGGTKEYYRFFALTDPAIKRKIRLEGSAIKNSQKIAKVIPLSEMRIMYDITTSTENFIANGLISHNCYAPKYRDIYGLGKGFGQVTARKVEMVCAEAEEVVANWRTELFYFQDDVFPVWKKEWIDEFCKHWNGTPFHIQIRAEMIHGDLIKKLKAVGLHGVTFAVESGVERIRKDILNRKMSNEQIIEAATILKKNGVRFRIENMIGVLDETFADTLQTLKLNIKCKPDLAWASLWQPYPGTELGDEAVRRGLFNPESDEIGFDFFHDTILVGKESAWISNIRKLFGVTVRFPVLAFLVPLLCKLPKNRLYAWIYRKFKQWAYESRLYKVKPHLRGSKQMEE